MASDGYAVPISALDPLHGSQTPSSVGSDRGGKSKPATGKSPAGSAVFEGTETAAAVSNAPSISAPTSSSPSSTAAAPARVFEAVTAAIPPADIQTSSQTASPDAEAPAPGLKAPEQRASEATVSATQLKNNNDSGRADQFRVDPANDTLIQQINPATGKVVGQFSIDEFPALTKSIGETGLFIDALV